MLASLKTSYHRHVLLSRNLTPKTFKAHWRAIENLCQWLGHEQIKSITSGDIKVYLQEAREHNGWTAKTLYNQRQALKTWFSWAVTEGLIKQNPVTEIPIPKLPNYTPRFIEDQNLDRFLCSLRLMDWRTDYERARNECFVYTLLFSGLRISEALGLRVVDVSLDRGEILVRQGKGKRDRIIPLHPKLKQIMRRYFQHEKFSHQKPVWVFTGAGSDIKLSVKHASQMLQKASRESGIKVTAHMLRHTFARKAINGGLGIYQVKEILGHSQIVSTLRYLSIAQERLKHDFSTLAIHH